MSDMIENPQERIRFLEELCNKQKNLIELRRGMGLELEKSNATIIMIEKICLSDKHKDKIKDILTECNKASNDKLRHGGENKNV